MPVSEPLWTLLRRSSAPEALRAFFSLDRAEPSMDWLLHVCWHFKLREAHA
jgi:hypothetical protein